MLTNLKSRGIEVESADVVLRNLAEAHNMTPVQLYNIALGQAGPGRGQGGHGQRGDRQGEGVAEHEQGGTIRIGRMTLNAYCNGNGLNVNEAVKKLQSAGFKASSDMTIRNIADSTGVHPSEIRTLLEPPVQ